MHASLTGGKGLRQRLARREDGGACLLGLRQADPGLAATEQEDRAQQKDPGKDSLAHRLALIGGRGACLLAELKAAQAVEHFLKYFTVEADQIGDETDQEGLKADDEKHRRQDEGLDVTRPVTVDVIIQEASGDEKPASRKSRLKRVKTRKGRYIV